MSQLPESTHCPRGKHVCVELRKVVLWKVAAATARDQVLTVPHPAATRERVEKALISIGKEELEKIIREDKKANLHCHFCNKEYDFNEGELIQLLEEAK